jgi:hypothetical protein
MCIYVHPTIRLMKKLTLLYMMCNICINVCMCIYMSVYKCVYIYIHICKYVNIHIQLNEETGTVLYDVKQCM